jgi:hypothetical protein
MGLWCLTEPPPHPFGLKEASGLGVRAGRGPFTALFWGSRTDDRLQEEGTQGATQVLPCQGDLSIP